MHKSLFVALISFSALPATVATAATDQISFRHLEASQRRDPLLPSPMATGYLQHTTPDRLEQATAALNSEIPAGTPRAEAEATLRKAGAHCRTADGSAETCTYFDVQTRDEYMDAVHWNVRLQLDGDRVSGLSIDRTWLRS